MYALGGKHSRHSPHPKACRICLAGASMLERVESRRLLSSSLSNGVLRIIGSAANDVITVSFDGKKVTVVENGQSRQFATTSIPKVNADGGAGNDSISVGKTLSRPATLLGGNGN